MQALLIEKDYFMQMHGITILKYITNVKVY